ncbi:ABSCISIC ACID-INSENSITIVE 5-like protein 2 [Phragmites australis]|uniref:ABSCISIC ACID-INSENSITIVE 5-like protein 2 n=1 Tax=Phragmites australis TaxID=29695 RepID=UPI002D797258|nr:ABSCISIC ACID-INSENSITIVE 5-like protein 2 [Phragmites australis]XP_062224457.1 ABSCISIC ACID-INSENSITIVE 5-like protein 2 [Phragmites australis]
MGSQTMASQAGGGGGGAGTGTAQRGQMQSLGRQGSLYSLTLDEVQSHLGEPLHSMNLDELLKSVFPDGVDPDGATASQYEQTSSLLRQRSITMPRELSNKTVDEVWKGIQDAPKRNVEEGGGRRWERQPTLGEMTLEDFLVKAGVVTEGYPKDLNDIGNVDQVGSAGAAEMTTGAQWLERYQQQFTAIERRQHGQQSMPGAYLPRRLALQPLNVGPGAILESAYHDGYITSPMMDALSDSPTPGRKRGSSGDVADKLIERRQKRMIKNRESAARSRARKQAYTNELENKVSRLEEENERLKRQKELEKILFSVPLPEPKYQLRRTGSATF